MKFNPLKSICFAILAAAASGLALAQTAPVPKPKQIPEPGFPTQADNTKYLNRPTLMVDCTARVAAIKGKPCDVIFIGDSITAGWVGRGKEIWAKDYEPRHALDFGIGGDKTQNVLWRLEHMDVHALRPKVAVILIGTNNLGNTPADIAAGVKAVIDKTQDTFPGVKTILVSIMPNKRANAKMMAVDGLIRPYADNRTVYYLDLVPLMPPIGDNWTGLGSDHLHPVAAGYQIWADAMEPLLTKLLAGR